MKISPLTKPLIFLLVVPGILASIVPAWSASKDGLPVVRIAILVDGPWGRNPEILGEIRQEILTLCEREFAVEFPPDKQRTGDWTRESVRRELDALLADPGVDMILAMGVMASDDACRRGPLPKPVLAPITIDPVMQGLPLRNGASGVKNLSYLTLPKTLERDIRMFRTIASFDHLAVVTDRNVIESIPSLGRTIPALLDSMGIRSTFVPVGDSVEDVWAGLPEDAEAVYVFPLLQLPPGDFDLLVRGLIERKLPSFSYLGENEVRRGIEAGLNPDMFPRLSRRIALNVQRILLGDEPGSIPTAFSAGERLILNTATARAIGKYPDWGVITEAVLVGEEPEPIERHETLTSVMEEAMAVNLDLAASIHTVNAGEAQVGKARSNLLPQVELSALGLGIDEDRAALGNPPERSLSGTAELRQVLFSDPAFAGLSIEKHLQDARKADRENLRLDVVQTAASGYLEVLRAKTLERIQKENLGLSRTNLELARVREAIGQSGASDVYRWESQIATNRKDAIEANARRNAAEISLNRVLHRPLEEPFEAREIVVEDPRDLVADYPYLRYFNDKVSFRHFRDFMVREGLDRSPELAAIDGAVAAAERSHSAAGRRFFLPTLGLSGSVTRVFDKSGAGADGPGFPGLDIDDTSWEVGVQLTYPLLAGGGKFSERSRASEELASLRLQRRAAAERIEQRVRIAAHLAGASYAGIRQAMDAADAARRNFELVTDAYSGGTVSIIELLDAQNAYIVANAGAASAVYNFLLDLMELQRAGGRFDPLTPDDEMQEFLTRLDRAMEE